MDANHYITDKFGIPFLSRLDVTQPPQGLKIIGKTKERLNIFYDKKSVRFNNTSLYIYEPTRYTSWRDLIIIEPMVTINNLDIQFHDGYLYIGKWSIIHGGKFVVEEGKGIHIGRRCLFGINVEIRTSDSHSIFDMDGKRINLPKNVYIGNHVWVCKHVSILKGSSIQDDSVLGTYSLLSSIIDESNVIIAGNPAKIIKRGIQWDIKLTDSQ